MTVKWQNFKTFKNAISNSGYRDLIPCKISVSSIHNFMNYLVIIFSSFASWFLLSVRHFYLSSTYFSHVCKCIIYDEKAVNLGDCLSCSFEWMSFYRSLINYEINGRYWEVLKRVSQQTVGSMMS